MNTRSQAPASTIIDAITREIFAEVLSIRVLAKKGVNRLTMR